MKEIKFRAWDKKASKMYYENDGEFLLFRCINGKIFVPRVGGFFNGEMPVFCETDNVIPMQFTGLKDSQNIEEYFGDIIEEDDSTRRVIEDEASVVAFRIVGGKNIKYFWDLLPHKVIGNIYENPELLEGK